MASISLCMIVKNEEAVLGRCLDSVKELVDEIIIVDTGSTDQTKKIAQKYTKDIYDFQWVHDFSAARNYSFSKATKDYILWMDADDVLLEKDREAFILFKQNMDTGTDVYMLLYNVAFDEKGNPTMSYYRERLLKREKNFLWQDPVHEVITPAGKIEHIEIAITHRKIHPVQPGRNLEIYQNMLRNGVVFNQRQLFYYARELYYNGLYEEAVRVFHKFLENPEGFIENKINACQDLSYAYQALGKKEDALKALFQSFLYDKPRAEICCAVGWCFMAEKNDEAAVFWYEMAGNLKPDITKGGFYKLDCYGYIPNIQLCVLYDRLGKKELAARCNEKAASYKPDSKAVKANREYFRQFGLDLNN